MKKNVWLILLGLIFGLNTPIFAAHDGAGEHCKMHTKNHLKRRILIEMERLIAKKQRLFAKRISILWIKTVMAHCLKKNLMHVRVKKVNQAIKKPLNQRK